MRRRETCTKRVVHGDKSVNQEAIDKQTNCHFQKTSLRLKEPQTTQISSAFVLHFSKLERSSKLLGIVVLYLGATWKNKCTEAKS